MRQDVGQDDCGLNILNKRQRVGIINIYSHYYYYQVSKFYTEMELYFLRCHGLLQDKRQQKYVDDVSICCYNKKINGNKPFF